MTARARTALLILAAVSTIACDRGTKMLASAHLAGAPARSYLGGSVRILYAENTGAFLSLGSGAPEWLRRDVLSAFIGLSLLAIGVLAWRQRAHALAGLGLGLLWAGGLSNLVDRLRDGHVVDFMMLVAGPLRTGVFNVADVAITTGVAMVLFARKPEAPRQEAT
jgi:signal peptidase II